MSDETFREMAKPDDAKGEKWISPHEAAEQLGISIRAVQIRAQRGTLPSKREDRKLYVCLDALEETSSRKADESFRETAKDSETPDATPFTSLVEHQAEEIAFLRARIEEHEAEIRRRDVAESELRRLMLADKNELQALRQSAALMIAPSAEDKEEKAAETPALAWWQRWPRQWRRKERS
jgi:hypothetical protein